MDNQQPIFQVYISSDGERFYIGCQKGTDPDYKGSYSDPTFKPTYKIVLKQFDDRVEAGKAEQELIRGLNAIQKDSFVNKAIVPVDSLEDLRQRALDVYEKDPSVKDKISKSVEERWKDPEYQKKQSESKHILSKAMKEHWSDPEYKKRVSESISKSLLNSEVRNTPEYKAREKEYSKRGAEGSKRFFSNLKKDPEAYKAYMEERGRKISEGRRRKQVQRPEQSS